MVAIEHNQNTRPETDTSDPSLGRVLMQVNGLRKSFGGQTVLDGVDLDLHEGEVVLLRGENGSGKTTLLNILTGNMEPDVGDIHLYVNSHPEHFRFPRRWWQEINPWDHFTPERVASEGVGRTWQDTRLFGSQTLLDNLAVASPDQPGEKPWHILSRPRRCLQAEAENRQAVQALLNALELGDRCESSADMISLGQTKRIAFARCARANTKIVFLDEPLAGLDQKGIASIIAVLRELAVAHRLTLVIVEHVFNIPIILDFATAVWTLADGRLTRETIAEAKADPAVRNTNNLSSMIRQLAGPDAVITEGP
ncbi:MAG: ATP-binding cassette domain-containing protein, partial [Pseudomonadota bacterium]